MNLSEATQQLQALIKSFPNPEQIPSSELRTTYQLFIDTLTDHNHLYYINAKPIISDAEYDELFAYLKAIEEYFPTIISSTSPTQGLVGQLSDGFKKAEHLVPLLSLENSYNAEDLRERAVRIAKIAEKTGKLTWMYHLEPKFDGLSVEFIYQEGHFIQAITRGDGKIGEDITTNVKMITDFPKKISSPGKLHFRGEILMPKSQFLKLNQAREKAEQSPFSNTRNAAAGSIKLLDSGEVAKRGLKIVIYEQLAGEIQDFEQLGLPVFNLPQKWRNSNDIEQIISWCQDFELKQYLDEQDLDFDGLVIKVSDDKEKQLSTGSFPENSVGDSLFTIQTPPDPSSLKNAKATQNIRSLLGSTEHHPRWAIAYKFPAQQIASQILSIDFQVGRTGIITPVANIEPVSLSGAMISRVSLHNFDFIQNKQIKSGDFVWVQRSGEVIPYIVAVIKERRTGREEPILPPLFCPACSSPICNVDIHYYCSNPKCPAQIREKIVHFASRDAMDISGIGEAIIETLVQQKMLTSVADLYQLTKIENQILMRKFPSFAEKKISELVLQLEASKKRPLWRVLNAIGFPNIGKKTAQDLANYLASKKVHSLNELLKAFADEEIKMLYGIGEKIVQGIQLFISSPETLKLLYDLEAAGVNFDATKTEKKESGFSKGIFSLTGTFPISRGELIAQMGKQGYQYEEQPNSSTQRMLIGEKAGAKAEKAKKLGIPCYEERKIIVQEFGLSTDLPTSSVQKQILQGGLF
ncbi:MAG: hypothetical protein DLD55_05275 [candidate division SR1 bacterium]|nr:MAG: hypothetical protein DLD55_05275 [candidate division SR1 bacterium]